MVPHGIVLRTAVTASACGTDRHVREVAAQTPNVPTPVAAIWSRSLRRFVLVEDVTAEAAGRGSGASTWDGSTATVPVTHIFHLARATHPDHVHLGWRRLLGRWLRRRRRRSTLLRRRRRRLAAIVVAEAPCCTTTTATTTSTTWAAEMAQEAVLRLRNGLEPTLGLLSIVTLVLVRMEDERQTPECLLDIVGCAVSREA
mmetsp:Transcript_104041/g.333510  ORF Transcript_104041/g.333510 Transcript_104041/m.333510 type:complete len:200 (+) Transcript_104041:305-904(+)